MRRLLAAATLAALALSLAVPLASAHLDQEEHVLEWGSSPDPATANDGGQVFSDDEVVGARANFKDGIKSWDVVISPVDGGPPSTCHEDLAQGQNGKYPEIVYISCPWDTTRATEHTLVGATLGQDASNPRFSRTWQSRGLGPTRNGRYTIKVAVTNTGAGYTCDLLRRCQWPVDEHALYEPGTDPPRFRELFVVNDVADPGGVNSSFDQASNRISVTWAPNPEPDISYIVQEKVGDGKWNGGVGVGGTRYERTLDQPGRYQYQVAAVRPAPTRDKSDATVRSDYVAASAVDVAQITPPATAGVGAPGPNSADGAPVEGGDQGGFAPTDPSSPTSATTGGRAKPQQTTGRASGPAARPSGSPGRSPGAPAETPGEAEGEELDPGYSAQLPYKQKQGGEVGLGEGGEGDLGEEEPQTLAGGVVPKPRDTRQLMIFTAGALALFVFAMQLTVLLRRSRPATATAVGQSYHDDFDEWLGF